MKYIKLLYALLLCASTLIVHAQVADTLEIQRNENGKINFARLKATDTIKMKDGSVLLKNILQIKNDDAFQLTKESKDNYEITHQRYQQYYKGVKVEGAEYLVHGKKGNIETINGNFQDIYISSVMPSLNEQQALAKALGFVNAKKYKWEDNATEKFLKQNTDNLKATYYPNAELVISKDFLMGSKSFKLSYKFTISSLQPNNEQLIFVDAITGDIINNQSLISDVNTPCTAQTRYSGNLPITGDSFTGGFRLREVRNGVNVQTLNCSSQSNYAVATDFTNNNINWITGSWATITQNQGALDAHWAEESVLDFWRTVFNRNSINGNGINVVGYVHYFDASSTAGWPNNAQWDGTNNAMRYGDGDGVTFRSLTALDVVGHEFGHGITQYTASLGTGSSGVDEAAALNEGFSDIWGACVENFVAPAKQTWLMGEEIMANGISCLRNLQNPKSTTAAEGQHPDTYHGTFWRADGESHNNSTVLSHWFFLLSQGGNGTNDIGSVFSVNSIGISNARRIAYQAESNYIHPGATYATVRTNTIQAARDLYGIGSCEEIAVTRAWFAVGVGANFIGVTPPPTITGVDYICSGDGTYTVPNGVSVTWTVIPATGVVNKLVTGNSIKLTQIGNGVVTLSAIANTACSPNLVTVTKDINVGLPVTNYKLSTIQTLTTLCGWDVILLNFCNATGFIWQNNHPLVYTNETGITPPYHYLVEQNVDYGPITKNYTIAAVNQCGTGSFVTKSVNIKARWRGGNCSLPVRMQQNDVSTSNIIISPNPTFNQITVTKNDNVGFYQIKIFDKMGVLKKQFTYPKKTRRVNINVSGFATDIYQVHVFDGIIWKNIPFSKL